MRGAQDGVDRDPVRSEDPTQGRTGRAELLEDYVAIARQSGWAIEATALRTGSADLREVLAHAATGGRLSLAGLREAMSTGSDPGLEPTWAARLARVVALQDFGPDDRPFAGALLDLVGPRLGTDVQRFRRLRLELLIEARRFSEAGALLGADSDLRALYDDYYAVDLLNPFVAGPLGDAAAWLTGFARVFTAHGLEPVGLREGDGLPFDRMVGTATSTVEDGPLVTVMVTTFRPEREPLLAAVRSLLAQSWTSLEVLVVDDASPEEHLPVLDEVVGLDARVRLVRLPENRGTYGARNVALEQARGEFVTNQDDDDWSHPRRLERQVAPLLADPGLPATRATAVSADERLLRSRPGYNPVAPHAATLLFRADVARRLGGYLPARRAADNEFHHRMSAACGSKVLDLEPPLAVYRIRSDSLSRGDFRAGWAHPSRRAFRDAYAHWHATAPVAELTVRQSEGAPIPVPTRFQVSPSPAARCDVVYVSDWRGTGALQRAGVAEVDALVSAGLRVGVAHLEAARFLSGAAGRLSRPLQAMINDGRVVQVLPDDRVRTALVVVGYAPVLQFAPASPFTWDVDEVVVLVNQLPSDVEGLDHRYRIDDCADNAVRLMGRRPLWVPEGPAVREALRDVVPASELADVDLATVVDVDRLSTPRRHPRSDRPVIGRHGGDGRFKWPKSPRQLRAVYPVDGSFDVRFMGGAATATRRLGLKRPPPAWVVFEAGELPVRTFLSSLDFFVSDPDSRVRTTLVRPVLEAAAAGSVVLLPPRLEAAFGEVACYAEPEDAAELVRRAHGAPRSYRETSARGQDAVRRRHGASRYVDVVASLVAGRRSERMGDDA